MLQMFDLQMELETHTVVTLREAEQIVSSWMQEGDKLVVNKITDDLFQLLIWETALKPADVWGLFIVP